MKKLALLTAVGALSLTGCDFAGASGDHAALPVANIEASGMTVPATAADADGSTEVFVEIQNAAGQTIWRSETRATVAAQSEDQVGNNAEEVLAPQSFQVPNAIEVAAATQGVMVAVWEYDTSYTDSQLIARSQTFTAADLAAQPELVLATGVGTGSIKVSAQAAE